MASIEYEEHPLLPIDAPKGQPHILKPNLESVIGHQLCDFIATLLFNLEQHPDALKDFFDPEVKSFKFIWHVKEHSDMMPIIVWRKDKIVLVCMLRPVTDGSVRLKAPLGCLP